jgi:hypothetical protein
MSFMRRSSEPRAPHPSHRAGRELAERDRWPWPPPLRILTRALTGAPTRSALDQAAMRADADRIGSRAGRRSAAGDPAGPPSAGLEGLVARSEYRAVAGTKRLVRRLVRALGQATAHQASLDRRQGELDAAARVHSAAQAAIPTDRPPFGLALTSRGARLTALVLLLIPLEAYLTYPSLQVLQLSDVVTMRLSVLIGAGIAIAAEVIGISLAYLARHGQAHASDPRHRVLVLFASLLVLAGLVAGLATAVQLASSREHNLQIAAAVKATNTTPAPTGFGGAPAPSGGAAGFSSSPAAGTTPATATARPDLAWTAGLQILAFLAAIAIAMRGELAAPYRHALRNERRARRRVTHTERRVRRSEARTAHALTALDGARRALPHHVSAEHAQLRALLDRASDRHAEELAAARLPAQPFPTPPPFDAERLTQTFLDPQLPHLEQPAITRVPVGRTPEPPPAHDAAVRDVPDPDAEPLGSPDSIAPSPLPDVQPGPGDFTAPEANIELLSPFGAANSERPATPRTASNNGSQAAGGQEESREASGSQQTAYSPFAAPSAPLDLGSLDPSPADQAPAAEPAAPSTGADQDSDATREPIAAR